MRPTPRFTLALAVSLVAATAPSAAQQPPAATGSTAATPAAPVAPAVAPAPPAAPPPAAEGTTPPPSTPAPAVPAPASPAPTTSASGPEIDLAPVAATPSADLEATQVADDERPPAFDSLKGLRDQRLAEADPTRIGGYGELHYNLENLGAPGDPEATLDLHRLVLFVAHRFDDRFRFYSEIEVEHAASGEGLGGEVSIEQAYLDYRLCGDALGLRAGVLLVPMGIINQWHEPPVFHGVERPTVDRLIIPATWREAGIGIFGEPAEGVRYELYLVGGLDPSGFSPDAGIRGGRQAVSEARADGLAVTARVEVEPSLGFVGGVSGYVGASGPNADFFLEDGSPGTLDVPVAGLSWDVRGKGHGVEARALVALFSIGDTDDLRQAFDADGNSLGLDLGAFLWGAYAEIAFDVLSRSGSDQQLLPFVRLERYDTMAEVKGRPALPTDAQYAATEVVLGVSYRPLPQVAFKTDYVRRDPDANSGQDSRFDLGVGLMF